MKIILAVTGASGSIYAQLILKALSKAPSVEKIAVIRSKNAIDVWQYELQEDWTEHPKINYFENNDFFTSVASGSSDWNAMLILPASMGCLGRIAIGVSNDLISRAADVILKEDKTLIVCPRETPLSMIHLENMLKLKQAGAKVLPCTPSFYSQPQTIEQLAMTVVERILDHLNIDHKAYRWG